MGPKGFFSFCGVPFVTRVEFKTLRPGDRVWGQVLKRGPIVTGTFDRFSAKDPGAAHVWVDGREGETEVWHWEWLEHQEPPL